jgi:hypothetical protein
MTRKNLQSIMNLAWRFVKENGMTMGEALKVSWKNAKLYVAMCKSIVNFSFRKIDGTLRQSRGTLCHEYIPAGNLPKGTGTTKNAKCQAYFDLDKQEWRSFKRENLL